MDKEELAKLMKFYQVDSLEALVEAQDRHIASLQESLQKATPEQPIFVGRSPRFA